MIALASCLAGGVRQGSGVVLRHPLPNPVDLDGPVLRCSFCGGLVTGIQDTAGWRPNQNCECGEVAP